MHVLRKAIGLVFLLVVLTAPVEAALISAVSINGAPAACATDNNTACGFGTQILDINPDVNVMSFGNNPIDLLGLVVTGASQQATFGGLQNILNTSSTQIENTTGQTMTVQVAVSATNFTPQALLAFISGSATWENAVGSSILMRWYNDSGNAQGAEFATDTPGTLLGQCFDTVTLEADATACSFGSIPVNDLGLFSMTLFTEFVITPGALVVNRGQTMIKPVVQAPEPASMALFGLALAAGAWRVRRRKGL